MDETGAGTSRVLLVDDSPVQREVLAEALVELGLAVVTAKDGLEALRLLRSASANHLPDLILANLSMPGLGGRELRERLDHDPAFRSLTVLLYSAAEASDREPDVLSVTEVADAAENVLRMIRELRQQGTR